MDVVVKEEVSSGEEEDNEEEEWSGGDYVKMEDEEVDQNKKKRWSKRSEKSKEAHMLARRRRQERMRKVVAGEEVEGMGEEEKERLLALWEKERERKKRDNAKRAEKNGGRKRADYRKRDPNLTAEEKCKLRLEKERLRLLEKKMRMTEEEQEEERKKAYFRHRGWFDSLSKEEQEDQRRKHRENSRKKWGRIGEEERKKITQNNKEWRRNLNMEQKKRYLDSVNRSVKKWLAKKKLEDPEGTRRKYRENSKKGWDRLGEEGRRRRLGMMKIYQRKRRLRKELEGKGVVVEEIEGRVKELEEMLKVELGIPPPKKPGRQKKEEGTVHTGKIEASTIGNVVRVENIDDFWDRGDPRNYGAVHKENTEVEEDFGGGGGGDYFDDFDDGPLHSELIEVPQPPTRLEVNVLPKLDLHEGRLPPSLEIKPVKLAVTSVTTAVVMAPPVLSREVQTLLPVAAVEKNAFECTFCPMSLPKSFGSETELKEHLKVKHASMCWRCPICKEVVLSPEQLSEHFEAVHGNKEKKVENEGKSSSSIKVGGEVERNMEFLCMKCPWKQSKSKRRSDEVKIFKDWRELHEHVKTKHGKYYWPCEKCHILKYSKERFNLHKKICK